MPQHMTTLQHIFAAGGTDGEHMARVAVDAHGSGRPGGRSGARDALRHWRDTRALGTVDDADLEVAEAASCDGEMLENMWQTEPCLLTPQRGLAVAVMDRFLSASEARDRGNC